MSAMLGRMGRRVVTRGGTSGGISGRMPGLILALILSLAPGLLMGCGSSSDRTIDPAPDSTEVDDPSGTQPTLPPDHGGSIPGPTPDAVPGDRPVLEDVAVRVPPNCTQGVAELVASARVGVDPPVRVLTAIVGGVQSAVVPSGADGRTEVRLVVPCTGAPAMVLLIASTADGRSSTQATAVDLPTMNAGR